MGHGIGFALGREAYARKGEADRAQIEADRGEHTFWYDAINDLMDKDVPALYDAALAEHGFHPVDEPSYDLVSVKKDEGFVATATVALQPELNLTQTTGFVVECVTPAVTDKEIDAVLERRRNAAAELVPHKGPAVKGNVVHMDFEGLLDGVAFQGGTAKNQAVQLGSGRMIPALRTASWATRQATNSTSTSPSRSATMQRTWPARLWCSRSSCTTCACASCLP